MLKTIASAALLLGTTAALPAMATPIVPQSPPAASNIVRVQGWGERCHWLRERIREHESRLYYAPPWERPRIERRLFELREEFRGTCRRGY